MSNPMLAYLVDLAHPRGCILYLNLATVKLIIKYSKLTYSHTPCNILRPWIFNGLGIGLAREQKVWNSLYTVYCVLNLDVRVKLQKFNIHRNISTFLNGKFDKLILKSRNRVVQSERKTDKEIDIHVYW